MIKLKAVKCFAMILLTINASFNMLPVTTEAKQEFKGGNYGSENVRFEGVESFAKGRKHYKFTNKKIEEEIKHQSGKVDSRLEEYLNENGIFDSDMNEMGIDNIKAMEQIDIDDIQIYCGYFAIEDTNERKGQTVTEEEMIPLSQEEINELIEEEYYEEEIIGQKDDSSISEFLDSIGMESVRAEAKTETKGGINDKENYSLLKKIVTVYKCKGKMEPYYCITYTCIWTKMPENTNLDVASIKWSGAYYDGEDIVNKEMGVSQRWKEDVYDYVDQSKYVKLNRTITDKMKEFSYYANPNNLKAGQYFVDDNSMCCAVKLHEKKEAEQVILSTQKIKECYDESIAMVIYVKRDKKYNIMTVYPYYCHSKTRYDLGTVGVSILSGGYINALYYLTSGKMVSIETDYSGIEWNFTYNYNTYK